MPFLTDINIDIGYRHRALLFMDQKYHIRILIPVAYALYPRNISIFQWCLLPSLLCLLVVLDTACLCVALPCLVLPYLVLCCLVFSCFVSCLFLCRVVLSCLVLCCLSYVVVVFPCLPLPCLARVVLSIFRFFLPASVVRFFHFDNKG